MEPSQVSKGRLPCPLSYEEPEDEGEGDPQEHLLQELLLLELRRPRPRVISGPGDGAAVSTVAEVHVGGEKAEGERADAEGHLKSHIAE